MGVFLGKLPAPTSPALFSGGCPPALNRAALPIQIHVYQHVPKPIVSTPDWHKIGASFAQVGEQFYKGRFVGRLVGWLSLCKERQM